MTEGGTFGHVDVGVDLSSRAASRQVFSARMSLTTVFGMGTGGPSSSFTPTGTLLYTASVIYPIGFLRFMVIGDPYEIRTRVAGVRGRSLRPLDQRAVLVHHHGLEPWTP